MLKRCSKITITCINCRTNFEISSGNERDKEAKLCKDCFPKRTTTRKCLDCNTILTLNNSELHIDRCPSCQNIYEDKKYRTPGIYYKGRSVSVKCGDCEKIFSAIVKIPTQIYCTDCQEEKVRKGEKNVKIR